MKTTRIGTILLLVLPWAASAFAIDPALSLGQNVIRSWGVDQGLPQGTVSALAQTADGYMWASTQEGFVRFDGPAPLAVTALAEDWSGQLWIGTLHGIATWKDGRLARHDDDGFPAAPILALCITRDGSVWIGTRGSGLLRYRSGQFRTYT